MYDFGDLPKANDRLWAAIRDNLRSQGLPAPETLTRDPEELWALWRAPDLVLAQTCGFPYRAKLHGHVTLIGTPDYQLEGCAPGEYCSVLVAQRDDDRPDFTAFHGANLAYNDVMSQSGWAAPQNYARSLGLTLLPGPMTGAHRDSARAVAEKRADLAALDAVTFRLLQRVEPQLTAALRVIGFTPPTPGLPLIAALGAPRGAVFAAVAAAIADLAPRDRDCLGIHGLVKIAAQSYLDVPNPPSPDHIGQSDCVN
ncbi:MAG: ABC-type phosphate/phosphonate transport system substrate-binding protein [Pseudorhodobacter sp.]|jgi:ABC-type phosphate/phosphonate transport system substrate-binding protein